MSNAPLNRFALNQATIRERASLKTAISLCADRGLGGIAVWRDKLSEMGVQIAAKSLRDSGLIVTSLCRGGMFPAHDAAGRQAAIDDNLRAIDDAALIDARALMIVAGGLPPGSRDLAATRKQIGEGLAAILPYARAAGVPIAIEPLHPMYAADRSAINTLSHALDLCDWLGDGVGVAIDVYHVWWDPDLETQIRRASGRILGFHVCDWLVPTRDLLLDRGMMGDGVIDIPLVRGWVEQAGYHGLTEVEIFSKDWWARSPAEVLDLCVERYRSAV